MTRVLPLTASFKKVVAHHAMKVEILEFFFIKWIFDVGKKELPSQK
jgi:hypothetical protein